MNTPASQMWFKYVQRRHLVLARVGELDVVGREHAEQAQRELGHHNPYLALRVTMGGTGYDANLDVVDREHGEQVQGEPGAEVVPAAGQLADNLLITC